VNTMPIFTKLWSESRVLTVTCVLMLLAFLCFVPGIYLDPRIITGAPAWLKPAKFAISTLIFAASMAWLFQYLTTSPKLKRGLAWTLSSALVLEVAIISVQAARGSTSHFNAGTALDGALFSVMGVGIAVLWICMLWVAVLLFRQRFANAAFGWALRFGMAISVAGASAAGLMLPPNQQQIETLKRHERPMTIGAHTVGAPDGGEGLPGVGWSARHGDLRIPHFFGLHALQVIPFCAWLFTRRRTATVKQETRAIFFIAVSYLALIAILTWQALRGQSIAEPDAATLSAFAAWLFATVSAMIWCRRGAPGKLAVSNRLIA